MYSFKVKDAEYAIREYLHGHPNSKVAAKALEGDCAAMMELYEKLCEPAEKVIEEGPSDDATFVIFEAVNRKYVPAMIRFAQDTMIDEEFWPNGLMMLMEAYELGGQEAMMQLRNNWNNCIKAIEARYKNGEWISKNEEFMLAFYYYYGIVTPKNEALALRLFQSSAKRGCDEASRLLSKIGPNEDS